MANTRSAEKRARQTKKRTLRNSMIKSMMKTASRRFREALEAKDLEKAQVAYRVASRVIDKAAAKGVIHKNTAARRKSRLSRRLSAAGVDS